MLCVYTVHTLAVAGFETNIINYPVLVKLDALHDESRLFLYICNVDPSHVCL